MCKNISWFWFVGFCKNKYFFIWKGYVWIVFFEYCVILVGVSIVINVYKLGLIDIFMYVLVEVDLNWNLMFGYFLEGLNVMGYLYKWDIDVISYYGM